MEYCLTNKVPGSYSREEKVMKALKAFFGNLPLNKIDTQRIESFKAKRVQEGLIPRSINKELAVLRFMLNKAVEWKYLKDTPYKKIRMLKPWDNPVKFLSAEEIDRLLDQASIHLKPILLVLRNSGMRTHKILNLRFSDVDLEKRTLLVRSQKTNSFRVIPMNQKLYQTMLWLHDNFPHPNTEKKVLPRAENQRKYVFCDLDGRKIWEKNREH
jgi:integrase